MATANRLHWIDTTKAICIICVYFAHCAAFTTGNINLIKAVSPFYVNAFFFVSGYLLYKKRLMDATLMNRFIKGNELFIVTFTLSIIISYIITLVICNYFPFLTDIRKVNIKSIR